MERRHFNKLCTGLVAGAASLHAHGDSAGSEIKKYARSALVLADQSPVNIHMLKAGGSLIFSYPYISTPCFLLRLSTQATANGSWPGGIGNDQSIVAFSAICSHKMSHPAKPVSHINYRSDTVNFYDSVGEAQSRTQLISCCSEHSIYDPADAGRVLSGPAPMPLAAIELEEDSNGNITAVGSIGDDQYDRFLENFGYRLAMEYKVSDVRQAAGEKTIATPADKFSQQRIRC
ncbi:MAG: hypothetical protein V3U65_03820 [Granulosicoccaceae bacterium]